MIDDIRPGLGWIESPPDERDWSIGDLYAVTGTPVPDTLPTSYVVPTPWPAVLNQGSTPRCVAFSLSTLKAYEDLRDQGSFDFDEGMFFAQIGGTASGAVIRDGLKHMLALGYPVVALGRAAQHRIAAYYAVPVTRAALCSAIATFGPLELGTPWAEAWFHPVAGVLPRFDVSAGGHAIAAVGWDERGLRLRNSWGTGWGLSGDAYLPWAELRHVREAWKAIDVIEPRPAASWTLHVAHNAVVHLATVTPAGCISGWTTHTWTSAASSAPCRRPVVKRGCASGQATLTFATRGAFAGRWVRVRTADGVTVTST